LALTALKILVVLQEQLRKPEVKLVFTFRHFVDTLQDLHNFFVVWKPRVGLLALFGLERYQVVLILCFDLEGLNRVW